MEAILQFCTSSLVHHAEFLRREVPQSHAIFQSYLFRTNEPVCKVKEIFITNLLDPEGLLTITGVPPHVEILRNEQGFKAALADIRQGVPKDIIESVEKIMEENAVARGTITQQFFLEQMKSIVGENMERLAKNGQNNQREEASDSGDKRKVYY